MITRSTAPALVAAAREQLIRSDNGRLVLEQLWLIATSAAPHTVVMGLRHPVSDTGLVTPGHDDSPAKMTPEVRAAIVAYGSLAVFRDGEGPPTDGQPGAISYRDYLRHGYRWPVLKAVALFMLFVALTRFFSGELTAPLTVMEVGFILWWGTVGVMVFTIVTVWSWLRYQRNHRQG